MAKPRKLLTITAEGLSAIGIEPQAPDSAPGGATETPSDTTRPTAPTEAGEAPKARRTRTGSKQEQLIAMLREGATIDETVAATGW